MVLASQPWIRWSWAHSHLHLIRSDLWEHIQLSLLAVGFGLLITFVLAALARAWHPLEGPLLVLTGTLYAVPSLALLTSVVVSLTASRT